MNLFIFFVLPLAIILLSIVLQKLLRSPILVAITFFAVFLIVSFISFADTLAEAIIASIIYTIIAYITATIVMIIHKYRKNCCDRIRMENERYDDETIMNNDKNYFINKEIYNTDRFINGDNYQKRCYRR